MSSNTITSGSTISTITGATASKAGGHSGGRQGRGGRGGRGQQGGVREKEALLGLPAPSSRVLPMRCKGMYLNAMMSRCTDTSMQRPCMEMFKKIHAKKNLFKFFQDMKPLFADKMAPPRVPLPTDPGNVPTEMEKIFWKEQVKGYCYWTTTPLTGNTAALSAVCWGQPVQQV